MPVALVQEAKSALTRHKTGLTLLADMPATSDYQQTGAVYGFPVRHLAPPYRVLAVLCLSLHLAAMLTSTACLGAPRQRQCDR
jgi:hypothetical protein